MYYIEIYGLLYVNRSLVPEARRLMLVKNGETSVLKTGSNMHLSGYDPVSVFLLIFDMLINK